MEHEFKLEYQVCVVDKTDVLYMPYLQIGSLTSIFWNILLDFIYFFLLVMNILVGLLNTYILMKNNGGKINDQSNHG